MDQELLASLLRDAAGPQQQNNEGAGASGGVQSETVQAIEAQAGSLIDAQAETPQLEADAAVPKPTIAIQDAPASRSRKSSELGGNKRDDDDDVMLDSQHKKIRIENRERKKRWREANEDRNKDNDLRCRVHKRAHKLYGRENSRVKEMWIESEFNKRKHKRQEKEGKGPDGFPLVDGTDIADLDQEELSNAIMATLTSFTAQTMQNGDAAHSSELNVLLQKLTNDPDALKNMLGDKNMSQEEAKDAQEQDEAQNHGAQEEQQREEQGAEQEANAEQDAPTSSEARQEPSSTGDVDLGNIDIHSIVGDLLGDDHAMLEGVATGAITLPAQTVARPASTENRGSRSSRRAGR